MAAKPNALCVNMCCNVMYIYVAFQTDCLFLMFDIFRKCVTQKNTIELTIWWTSTTEQRSKWVTEWMNEWGDWVTHPQLEEHLVLGQRSGPMWVLLQAEQGPVLVLHWTPWVHQQGPQLELLCYHHHRDNKLQVSGTMKNIGSICCTSINLPNLIHICQKNVCKKPFFLVLFFHFSVLSETLRRT